MAATFPAYEVQAAHGPFVKVEKPVEAPAPGKVRVKVHACGLCHADCFTKMGIWHHGVHYPRSPGHEVAGVVDALGEGVKKWTPGERVGVGWFGGACYVCDICREGDFILCDAAQSYVTGINYDGGYQQYIYASADALAAIPDELSFVDAAPLMCAGVTVFNSLRNAGIKQGATVGVQGIGGLGHLAIQFASKMGYRVFAFSRGMEKEQDALKLGAHKYFDTTDPTYIKQALALGGVNVLLATSTSPPAMSGILPALAKNGMLVILGAGPGKVEVDPGLMIGGRRKIMGFPSGTSYDSQECMQFAALHGIRSVNEVFPISDVAAAYERMMSYNAKFRVVVDWDFES